MHIIMKERKKRERERKKKKKREREKKEGETTVCSVLLQGHVDGTVSVPKPFPNLTEEADSLRV